MKLKNLRIGTWLLSGFSIILVLVILLGITSFWQTKQLQQQVETLYIHPLNVRRSIDTLELDITELRLEIRNLLLSETEAEEQDALRNMQILLNDVEQQFEIIDELYLGPVSDIDEAYQAFVVWTYERELNIELFNEGDIAAVLQSIHDDGAEGKKREILLTKIDVIDAFAQNKADTLYSESNSLYDSMVIQLSLIVSSIFLLTLVIGFWIYRGIKSPINKMLYAVDSFKSGNLDIRIDYETTNELGILASSINNMADVIQRNEKIHYKTDDFSDKIISVNDIHSFFLLSLKTLMENTNSIVSAVYLLHNNTYRCFESIGLGNGFKKEFSATDLEGEFANVITSQTIQHIKAVDKPFNYVFHAVTGSLVPNEIITMPIIRNNEVIAIISLASLEAYKEDDITFIERINDNLSSRIEAILAKEKISEFVKELEVRTEELKEQNIELETQKKQLSDASKLKTNFLSNMSHELRTPLNSVIALSGVLYDRLKDKIPDDEFGYLEIISRNGRNLLDLINDILDISRIESGVQDVEISKFNMNVLIEDVISIVKPEADQKSLPIIHKNKQKNVYIESDFDKCRHIIQNLLANAIKFTSKGHVEVEAKIENAYISITVTDTGIGIAEENFDVIFQEFRQADGSTSRQYGGTGLGLSIVKKYTEMLSGTIKLTSSLGTGSSFELKFPKTIQYINDININPKDISYHFDQQNQVSSNEHNVNIKDINDKTILLVEDNESAVIQIQNLVQGMGVKLVITNNGEEALQYLQNNIPDAMILDLMMPGINGFEVLIKLRNNDSTASIPVLILTAKHITKSELGVLKRNNVHQLIQKGNIDRIKLQKTIFDMLYQNHQEESKPKSKKTIKPKPTILVVEDNEDNVITIKALLMDYGEIVVARDGKNGIVKASKIKPDLILMDIALPDINGIKAFYEIKRKDDLKNIPIIAISASVLLEEKEEILSHGFNAFISKPIIAEDLFSVLKEVINHE